MDIPAGEGPIFTAYCHCDSCRRAHAAPLYHVAVVDESMFTVIAGAEHLQEFQREGGPVRAFCRVCGSRVLNRFPGWSPDGKTPIGFFPNLLEAATQKELPNALRPQRHNQPHQTVLDAEKLRGFFDPH